MCKEQTKQKPDAVGVAVEPEVRLCEVCEKPIKWSSAFGGWFHVDNDYSHLAETKEQTSEEEQAWLDELAKECHCCERCNGPGPCEGLMAGGFCDDTCFCGSEIDEDDYDYDDEEY